MSEIQIWSAILFMANEKNREIDLRMIPWGSVFSPWTRPACQVPAQSSGIGDSYPFALLRLLHQPKTLLPWTLPRKMYLYLGSLGLFPGRLNSVLTQNPTFFPIVYSRVTNQRFSFYQKVADSATNPIESLQFTFSLANLMAASILRLIPRTLINDLFFIPFAYPQYPIFVFIASFVKGYQSEILTV